MYSKLDLLTIAGNLFCERGYHGTTVRELARVLEVKESSLYAQINSKEEVLWEIVERIANLFLSQARAVPQNVTPVDQLKLLISGHLELIGSELRSATVYFQEWIYLEATLRVLIVEKRAEYDSYFQRAILTGVEQGVFQVENVQITTLYVLSILNWTYQWFDPTHDLDIKQLTQQYTMLILRALNATHI